VKLPWRRRSSLSASVGDNAIEHIEEEYSLYCSGDGSGVTDLISNATRLGPSTSEDPRPWLRDVAAGNDRLLTFLHEVTHNWCFSSAVVNTQLHLYARASVCADAFAYLSYLAAKSPEDPSLLDDVALLGAIIHGAFGEHDPRYRRDADQLRQKASLDIHDDLVRLEVIASVFRPLAEGLALFAQYDATSRIDSDAWSPLPLAVVWNFIGRESIAKVPSVEPLKTMTLAGNAVGKARLSPEAIRGKASVLASPLSSKGRGYLPGYLAVKSLWRHLCRIDERLFWETDLALMYIRSFFFDDAVIAATLLTPARADCIASANEIIAVFQRRLEVFDRVTADDVRAFEEYVSKDHAEEEHTPGLLRSSAETMQARAYIKQAVDDYRKGPLTAILPYGSDIVNRQLAELSEARAYVTVCSVPVIARKTPDGGLEVRWRGESVWYMAPADIIEIPNNVDQEFPATLDILLGLFGQRMLARFASLGSNGKAVGCSSVGAVAKQHAGLRDQIARGTVGRKERIDKGQGLRVLADRIVEEDFGLRFNRNYVREHTPDLVDKLYHDTALWFSKDATSRDRCAELMTEQGLRALLGSLDAVKRATFLGLAASLDARRDSIAKQFAERGYDLNKTLHELRACNERYGFPPLVEKDGDEPVLIAFL
jgi:hypothetical protein